MIETHPFQPFCPPGAKYLILGSFTANSINSDPAYDWYYVTKRNQFWPILESVYGTDLQAKESKQNLFTNLKIAITDIIYQCERRDGNSLDMNLISLVYNTKTIENILRLNKIEKIFFSSKYVEKEFRKISKN
jgi:G:T/U-mismatch repair DNA glycosylase